MALLIEAKRAEMGAKINSLISQIENEKVAITRLEEQLADLRKTVSEDLETYKVEDLAEVDATPAMTVIAEKVSTIKEIKPLSEAIL